MDMITMTPTAALRSRSESSFVVPSGTQGYWHLGVSTRGRTSGAFAGAAMAGIGLDVPTSTPPNNQTVVRNPRTTAKPAAPPRGEPR